MDDQSDVSADSSTVFPELGHAGETSGAEDGAGRVTVNLPKESRSAAVRVRLPNPPLSNAVSPHFVGTPQRVPSPSPLLPPFGSSGPGMGRMTESVPAAVHLMRRSSSMRSATASEQLMQAGPDSWTDWRGSPLTEEFEVLHYDDLLAAGREVHQVGLEGMHGYEVYAEASHPGLGPQFPPPTEYYYPPGGPPGSSALSDWGEMVRVISPEDQEGRMEAWHIAPYAEQDVHYRMPRRYTLESQVTVPDTEYSMNVYRPMYAGDASSVHGHPSMQYAMPNDSDSMIVSGYSEAPSVKADAHYADQQHHHHHHQQQHLHHIQHHHPGAMEQMDALFCDGSEYSEEYVASYVGQHGGTGVYEEHPYESLEEMAHSIDAEHPPPPYKMAALAPAPLAAMHEARAHLGVSPQPEELPEGTPITTYSTVTPSQAGSPGNYEMVGYAYDTSIDGAHTFGGFDHDADPERTRSRAGYERPSAHTELERETMHSPVSSHMAVAGSEHPGLPSARLTPNVAWSTVVGPATRPPSRNVSRAVSPFAESDKENVVAAEQRELGGENREATNLHMPHAHDHTLMPHLGGATRDEYLAMPGTAPPASPVYPIDPFVCDTRASSNTLELAQERTEELQRQAMASMFGHPSLQTVVEQPMLASSPPHHPLPALQPQPPPVMHHRLRAMDMKQGGQQEVRMASTPLACNVVDDDAFGVRARLASEAATPRLSASIAVQVPALDSPRLQVETTDSKVDACASDVSFTGSPALLQRKEPVVTASATTQTDTVVAPVGVADSAEPAGDSPAVLAQAQATTAVISVDDGASADAKVVETPAAVAAAAVKPTTQAVDDKPAESSEVHAVVDTRRWKTAQEWRRVILPGPTTRDLPMHSDYSHWSIDSARNITAMPSLHTGAFGPWDGARALGADSRVGGMYSDDDGKGDRSGQFGGDSDDDESSGHHVLPHYRARMDMRRSTSFLADAREEYAMSPPSAGYWSYHGSVGKHGQKCLHGERMYDSMSDIQDRSRADRRRIDDVWTPEKGQEEPTEKAKDAAKEKKLAISATKGRRHRDEKGEDGHRRRHDHRRSGSDESRSRASDRSSDSRECTCPQHGSRSPNSSDA
ncbi:hypothetical protein THASP1DRAFT_33374, partial [Thamnocephalis sphaerospora]